MLKDGITAHMMVKNEGRWCWYAIRSIIEHVDKIIIFDTGSSDKTLDCINWYLNNDKYKNKIFFEEKGTVDSKKIKDIRQEMIEITTTKWFMLLDGDEIWFEDGIKELIDIVKNSKYKMVATKFTNCVGNVYQRQNYTRDSYKIKNEVGSITIRAYSKEIAGINCNGDYGVEGFFCGEGREVQSYVDDIIIQHNRYLHTSYTMRASNFIGDLTIPYRIKKMISTYDYTVGTESFEFPEVFYLDAPRFVPNPFSRNWLYKIIKTLPVLLNKARLKTRNIGKPSEGKN